MRPSADRSILELPMANLGRNLEGFDARERRRMWQLAQVEEKRITGREYSTQHSISLPTLYCIGGMNVSQGPRWRDNGEKTGGRYEREADALFIDCTVIYRVEKNGLQNIAKQDLGRAGKQEQ